MTYACPKCRRMYRIKKNGVNIEEGAPIGEPNDHGEYDEWTAYKLYKGDLWECEGCGAQLVVPARAPLGEHYEPDYARKLAIYPPMCRIDDCPGQFDEERAARLQGKVLTDGN